MDDDDQREPERYDRVYRVLIAKGGPVYRMRLRHGKAYLHRQRQDGALELLVLPEDRLDFTDETH